MDSDSLGLARDSVILLEQIRTLDKRRLREKMGHLDEKLMQQVNDAISVSFGLSHPVGSPSTYTEAEAPAAVAAVVRPPEDPKTFG